jgi:hypothetical protein
MGRGLGLRVVVPGQIVLNHLPMAGQHKAMKVCNALSWRMLLLVLAVLWV